MEEKSAETTSARWLSLYGDGSDEPDLPPEYCRYQDEGCEFADSCLNCSLPMCIYELPGGKQHWLKRLRNTEVIRLFAAEGKGIKEIAFTFGISQRTVQRILKGTKDE